MKTRKGRSPESVSLATANSSRIVEQNNREKLLTKLAGMREGNLSDQEISEENDRIRKHLAGYARSFARLCWKRFNIKEDQIFVLPESEFRELETMIIEYATPRERWPKIGLATLWLVPVFGWFVAPLLAFEDGIAVRPADVWTFMHNRRELEKRFGKEFSIYRKWRDVMPY